TQDRFILTLYEKRVDPGDLPFFIAMLDHLAEKNCPVPPMIADRDGTKIQQLCGRYACLIKFLPGISVSLPTAAQAEATGQALGQMHDALKDFPGDRPNSMNHDTWRKLAIASSPSGPQSIASLRHVSWFMLLGRSPGKSLRASCIWPRACPVASACAAVGRLTEMPGRNLIRQA